MTSPEPARRDDVRMRGFAHRSRVSDVWQWLQDNIQPLPPEAIPVTTAAGRVLATAVTSEVDVPGFARAMMDGYAVQAADISGASTYNPVPLAVIDQSLPGQPARGR